MTRQKRAEIITRMIAERFPINAVEQSEIRDCLLNRNGADRLASFHNALIRASETWLDRLYRWVRETMKYG